MPALRQRFWIKEFKSGLITFALFMIISYVIHPFDVNDDTIPYWIGGPVCMAIWATALTWWHFRDKPGPL